ncbi:MAG: NAD(P)/FAD-dependent oxidoreductase [Actinomycetes bacterium]
MDADVVVIGAGAAGRLAALAARGVLAEDGAHAAPAADAPRVVLLDGEPRPGRKILIAGGGRCNVTNATVTESDVRSDDPKRARAVLRGFDVSATRRCFADLGVPLVEEPLGKLFPRSGRARDVLDALDRASRAGGVLHRFGVPVTDVSPAGAGGWLVALADGSSLAAVRVVLATGGLSVPATGSTGFGLELAARLGHALVPPVPALAPLLGTVGADLAGVTLPAIVTVTDRADGRVRARAGGSLLFTHRGCTGPAALDVSHEVERALAERRDVVVRADLWTLTDPAGPMSPWLADEKLPGACLPHPPDPTPVDVLDTHLREVADAEPRGTLASVLADRLPRRVATTLLGDVATVPLGQLRREDRRRAAATLTGLDLGVTGTGGYAKAEVTAGGVPLSELDRRTLESRHAPGLHLCGEVCDVTGRLGGFNFAWAWASGWLAGHAAGAASAGAPGAR